MKGIGAALAVVAGLCGFSQGALACADAGRSVTVSDGNRRIDLAALASSDPFRRFVEGLVPVLGDPLAKPSGRLDLRFERRRLGTPPKDEAAAAPAGALRFDSPWLAVRGIGDDACRTEMTVLWDEQQILADQAVLQGEGEGTVQARAAATPEAIATWARAYEAAAFRTSADERRRRIRALEGRIPFEFLWLFRNSVQSTRGPFEGYVADGLFQLQERTEPAYRGLVVALAASIPAAKGIPHSLRGIRDAASVFDIRSLRLETIR